MLLFPALGRAPTLPNARSACPKRIFLRFCARQMSQTFLSLRLEMVNDKGRCRSHPMLRRNAVPSLSPAVGSWALGVSAQPLVQRRR